VPFSEELPFEGMFPILSRVNLGEADFRRGTEKTVWQAGSGILAVPLTCYEVIYPGFVRDRLDANANLLINGTNDGWFGRSPGPYHHAAMSRLRCIEGGVSMVRSANTGISMLVDQYGRVLGRTPLWVRTVLTGDVPLKRVPTLYGRMGDWVVWLSLLLVVAGAAHLAWLRTRRRPA
jgi:apolipoprotein N-acyltransferase